MTDALVYEGVVGHRRLKPKKHRLKYAVFSFLLDLEKLDETAGRLRWFSRGSFNLFSFHDRDHGVGKPDDINRHIRDVLRDAGYDDIGRVLLLCYPRMLGYAFNPLSVYYCYDQAGRLSVMLYEVRNTFGGRHSYLIHVDGPRVDRETEKVFHVSPFNDMDMRYRFLITPPDESIRVFIQTSDNDGPVLNAVFKGARADLSDRKLLSLFFRYPLMTLKVIFGIHWEAIKLLAKGMRLRPGAPDPDCAVTIVGKPRAAAKDAA